MRTEVHSLRSLQPDYYFQRFISPPLAFQPGQFIMVKPSGLLEPFLPRAYSILRVRPTGSKGKKTTVIEIFYKIMGKGSRALAGLKPGDHVDLLGPLGTSYDVPSNLTTALLVAGGIGVPPVVALAERLGRSQPSVHGSQKGKFGSRTSAAGRPRMVAFIGGKTSDDVLCVNDFRKAGATVRVATEDGSHGHQGLVTELLESYVRSLDKNERSAIYACGPHPMLHAVGRVAERFEIPCQVSLEADMACGFGACMACVIPVHSSGSTIHGGKESVNREPSAVNERTYKLCCKDGPVFDAREVAW